MAVVKQVAGTRTAITVTGFATVGLNAYVVSAVKDNTANQPLDVMVEVTAATTNVPAGRLQIVVFAQASYDNINYQGGPTSGTSAVDEQVLTLLGVLPTAVTATTYTKAFSVASAYGGNLPPYFKIILKNDLGVSLTSGSVVTSEISATVI